MENSRGKILFSIDLEEFDITEEYGQQLPLQTKLDTSLAGMQALEKLMDRHGVRATIFTTACWAEHFPDYLRQLSERHEIASHTYYHNRFETADLLTSRLALSAITGKEVRGLRMPLMSKIDLADVREAGYLYDSSLHPTWLPGRYNNLDKKRTLHRNEGVWILPASVSPTFRIPVFWLAFKNFPFALYTRLCNDIVKKDGYMVSYVHPWEFTDLSAYNLPALIKRRDGQKLLDKLDRFFGYCKARGYSFDTHLSHVMKMSDLRSQMYDV